MRLDYNLPCFLTLALPPAPTVKRKLRYLKSQQQFLDLLRTCQNFLLKLFRPVNHTQRLRPCLLLCIHTLHSFGRVSSSLTVSPSETRSPTRDAAEPCHVLTSRDELGRSIIKAPSYPCKHAGRGSIVTDLYQFRLHIYNCKRLKYRSLYKTFSPSLLRAFFTSTFLSYPWSVTATVFSNLGIFFLQHSLSRWCPGAA